MATLHVRNVPDDLYERIRRQAAAQGRSVSAEVIMLLDRSVPRRPLSQAERDELFDRIDRQREELRRKHGLFPSSVEDIREDRER